jgi:hypothetical protein
MNLLHVFSDTLNERICYVLLAVRNITTSMNECKEATSSRGYLFVVFNACPAPPWITQGPHVLAHKTRFAGGLKNTINTFLFYFNGNPLTPLKRNYTSHIFQIISRTQSTRWRRNIGIEETLGWYQNYDISPIPKSRDCNRLEKTAEANVLP